VAIVAGGGGAVARFQPGVVLGTHHMAIGAGCGIVGEVRIAFRVDEGVSAEADQKAKSDSDQQSIADR